MSRPRSLRLLTAGLACAGLLLAPAAVAAPDSLPSVGAVSQPDAVDRAQARFSAELTDPTSAAAAAAYVAAQMQPGGFLLDAAGRPSVTLTAEGVLALVAVGGFDPTVSQMLTWLGGQAGSSSARPAEAAMITLAVVAAGGDPRAVQGTDLVGAMLADLGADGRVGTAALEDQVLVVLALARAGEPVPEVADRQLTGMRGSISDTFYPNAGLAALAVQALAPRDEQAVALREALFARDQLFATTDGAAWRGTDPEAAHTALAAQALAQVGFDVAGALAWLDSLQGADGGVRATEGAPVDLRSTALAALAFDGTSLATAGARALPPSDHSVHPSAFRLAGRDRYETAVSVSQRWSQSDVVVVASGQAFPDALSGGPLAGAFGAPLLLSKSFEVPFVTRREIQRLRPQEIIMLGGTSALDDFVESQLELLAPVTRITGSDRYAVSAAVAARWATADTVFVASGTSFPDGLTGSAAAVRQGSPVLLTKPGAVPSSVLSRLQALDPAQIVLLGGTAAVDARAEAQLAAVAPVTRITGPDRYAVSANLARWSGATPSAVLSSGADWPDALAAGPYAGSTGRPLLLTRPTSLPAVISGLLAQERTESVTAVGGSSAISPAVLAAIRLTVL